MPTPRCLVSRRDEIVHEYPERARNAVDGLLTRPGSCSPALRQQVYDYALSKAMGSTTVAGVPAELIAYVDKVILHAYKVTDRDVELLKQAGYSEDDIFEVTLSASFGASAARFDAGLDALLGSD